MRANLTKKTLGKCDKKGNAEFFSMAIFLLDTLVNSDSDTDIDNTNDCDEDDHGTTKKH